MSEHEEDKESEDKDDLKREYDKVRREIHELKAQLEGVRRDAFATTSTVVSPIPFPVRLDKDIAKRLWERLDLEPGITSVVCSGRSEQVDSYRKFEDFSEIADDGDKDILLVTFRKVGKRSSPIRVDYNVLGVGHAKVEVFGKQGDATSLKDDLVSIVSRGRVGTRWRRYGRWIWYAGSVICWVLLLFGVVAVVVNPDGGWRSLEPRTILKVGMLMGAASVTVGMLFGRFVVRPIGWLWPMVTIDLGRGIEMAERRRLIRRWVLGSLAGALILLGVRWLFRVGTL